MHKVTLKGHTSLTDCDDCGSTHIGGRCGMTFKQRLCSVRLDPKATPTRTKNNYYDQSSINDVFGDDSEEELMEDTKGLGALSSSDPRAEQLLAQAPETDDFV